MQEKNMSKPGSLPKDELQRECSQCKITKCITEYGKSGKGYRLRKCKLCWKPHNTKKRHFYRTEKLYGITEQQYGILLNQQQGVCAICKNRERVGSKRLAVDHEHETGVVRGLLCHHCNYAVGAMKDNPDTLEEAAKYVRKHQPK